MEHFKTIKLNLPKSGIDISDVNLDEPSTFIRKEWDNNPGVLQISVENPNPNHKDLIKLSKEFNYEDNFDLMNTKLGDCQYGMYGFVEFKNEEFPYVSVCYISDKKNILFQFVYSKLIASKGDRSADLKPLAVS